MPGSELDAQGALTVGEDTTVPATAAYTEGVHYWETTAAAVPSNSWYGVVGSDAAAPPPAGVLGERLSWLDAEAAVAQKVGLESATAVQGGISVLKAVDRYLRKFRLKSGANQVDLGKAAETAVDLYEHCTLVLFNGTK